MVGREGFDPVERIDAELGGTQRVGIDVRGVEQRALLESLFAEKYDEGVELFSCAAARDPDLQGWVRLQDRNDCFADSAVIGRIAKHLAHLNGEIVQQASQHRRISQKT